MAYPSIVVEIDFVNDPFGTSTTWTDVTSHVCGAPLVISYGRDNTVDDFQPGTCRFTLDNSDGQFDPANTSGPHYGKLIPRRRVRVRTAQQLWQGYITGWPQRRDYRNVGWVDITAVDAMSMLAQIEMPESIWAWRIQQYIDAGDVFAWWRMGDTSNVAVDASGSERHGTWRVWENSNDPVGGIPAPTTVLDAGRSGPVIPATVQPGSNFSLMQAEVGQPLGGTGSNTPRTVSLVGPQGSGSLLDGDWSLEVWGIFRQSFSVNVTGGPTSTFAIINPLVAWGPPGGRRWLLYLYPTSGFPVWEVTDDTGTAVAWGSDSLNLFDGVVHQIAITFVSSTHSLTLVVDGVAQWGLTTWTATQRPSGFPAVVNYAVATSYLLESTMGDVVLYSRRLTATELKNNWYAGRYGMYSSTGGTSLDTTTALAQVAGTVSPGPGFNWNSHVFVGFPVDSGPQAGSSVLDYLRKLAASEQGLLYADKAGVMHLWGRDWMTRNSLAKTVQYRFIDSAAVLGTEVGYAELTFHDGADRIQNDVTVTFVGGQQQAKNATSQATYGPVKGSVDTFLTNAEAALQVANFRVWRDGQPPAGGSYPDKLTIEPSTTTEFTMAGNLDIGTRINVSYTSLYDGSTLIADDFWIQSISHSIDVGQGLWQIVLGLMPADDPAKPFVLGTSTLGGADALWL